jgi:urocanate hydratase
MLLNQYEQEAVEPLAAALERLENDQTLLVESHRPVGIFRTHETAPRVLIAGNESWTYIGPQGMLPRLYEAFAGLAGKLVVSAALQDAEPLAATLNGAAFLGIEADPERIKRLLKTGYCDILVNSLDEAVRILRNAVYRKEAVSVGLTGNSAEVLAEMERRGIVPDLRTDQLLLPDPQDDVRWAALSGDTRDIAAIDELLLRLFPENQRLTRWISLARKRVKYQGLPARACRLNSDEWDRFFVAVNEMATRGELRAPVVIARDQYDGGRASWVAVCPSGDTQAIVADGSP